MTDFQVSDLGSALILSAGDRILRSRTFPENQQARFATTATTFNKSSSPQNAATSMLQACAPLP